MPTYRPVPHQEKLQWIQNLVTQNPQKIPALSVATISLRQIEVSAMFFNLRTITLGLTSHSSKLAALFNRSWTFTAVYSVNFSQPFNGVFRKLKNVSEIEISACCSSYVAMWKFWSIKRPSLNLVQGMTWTVLQSLSDGSKRFNCPTFENKFSSTEGLSPKSQFYLVQEFCHDAKIESVYGECPVTASVTQ